jgi:hypothetical protein
MFTALKKRHWALRPHRINLLLFVLPGSGVVQTTFTPLKGSSGGADREVMPSSVQFPVQPSYSAAMPGATTTTAVKVDSFYWETG